MKRLKAVTAAVVATLGFAGLIACDYDPTAPPLELIALATLGNNGNASEWDMSKEMRLIVMGTANLQGDCTLKIPAAPVNPLDPSTQVIIPVTKTPAESAFGYATWPAGVNMSKVPPGTYKPKLSCSKLGWKDTTVTVTLHAGINVLQSIVPHTWTWGMATQLAVNATNIGNGCELLIPAAPQGGQPQMRLPVARQNDTRGLVNVTPGDYPYSMSDPIPDGDRIDHKPIDASLECPGKINSGTVVVNMA